MKLNPTLNTYETNVKDESHSFSIGNEAVVIEILRNRLYSNPVQTLVQEYISNARDACREAGKEERIVVTLPTENSKVFKVRDYGVGISPDRIAKVFVQYSSSTKRDSDNQIGGFGIGAKSAWAYTDSFTVISYYEGIVRHYVAHLGKSNAGSLDLMHEAPTSEPNGAEIQIGVKGPDLNAFCEAVYRCTFFWEVRPELRGLANSDIPDWYKNVKPIQTINNVSFYERQALTGPFSNTFLFSIDGIPYAINHRFQEELNILNNISTYNVIVIKIPTGIVDISASRESLSDGAKNKAILTTLFTEIVNSLNKEIEKQLLACPSAGQFIKKYGELTQVYNIGNFKYSDEYVIHEIAQLTVPYGVYNTVLELAPVKRGDGERLAKIDTSWKNLWNYHILYNDTDAPKNVVYAKVRHYLKSRENKKAVVISFIGMPNKFPVDMEAIFLSSIELDKKIVVPKEVKNEVIVTIHGDNPRYRRVGIDTATINLDTNTDKFVYEVKRDIKEFTDQKNASEDIAHFIIEYTGHNYCFIASSNIKKIIDNPNFVSIEKFREGHLNYVTDEAKKKFDNYILYEKVGLNVDTKKLKPLLTEKIEDERMITCINLVFVREYLNKTHNTRMILEHYLQSNSQLQALIVDCTDKVACLKDYPLLSDIYSISNDNKEEVAFYLNARFHSLQGKKV